MARIPFSWRKYMCINQRASHLTLACKDICVDEHLDCPSPRKLFDVLAMSPAARPVMCLQPHTLHTLCCTMYSGNTRPIRSWSHEDSDKILACFFWLSDSLQLSLGCINNRGRLYLEDLLQRSSLKHPNHPGLKGNRFNCNNALVRPYQNPQTRRDLPSRKLC